MVCSICPAFLPLAPQYSFACCSQEMQLRLRHACIFFFQLPPQSVNSCKMHTLERATYRQACIAAPSACYMLYFAYTHFLQCDGVEESFVGHSPSMRFCINQWYTKIPLIDSVSRTHKLPQSGTCRCIKRIPLFDAVFPTHKILQCDTSG